MFKAGQKVKDRGGRTVEILAVLDVPDVNGHSIVGLQHSFAGKELVTWTMGGRFDVHQGVTSQDLELPPEIETRHVYPPIPDRRFDYCAWYSDQDENGPMGWGPTREEAIADLKDSYPREVEAA